MYASIRKNLPVYRYFVDTQSTTQPVRNRRTFCAAYGVLDVRRSPLSRTRVKQLAPVACNPRRPAGFRQSFSWTASADYPASSQFASAAAAFGVGVLRCLLGSLSCSDNDPLSYESLVTVPRQHQQQWMALHRLWVRFSLAAINCCRLPFPLSGGRGRNG